MIGVFSARCDLLPRDIDYFVTYFLTYRLIKTLNSSPAIVLAMQGFLLLTVVCTHQLTTLWLHPNPDISVLLVKFWTLDMKAIQEK